MMFTVITDWSANLLFAEYRIERVKIEEGACRLPLNLSKVSYSRHSHQCQIIISEPFQILRRHFEFPTEFPTEFTK